MSGLEVLGMLNHARVVGLFQWSAGHFERHRSDRTIDRVGIATKVTLLSRRTQLMELTAGPPDTYREASMANLPLKRYGVGLIGLVSLVGGAVTVLGFPKPNVVAQSWQLEIRCEPPRPIAITENDGLVHWYWYVPYKVVNNTGEERLFIPEVTVATDQGDIITAGQQIPGAVFKAIASDLDNVLLRNPIDVIGKLLQGDDMAKESVAIWAAFESDVDQLTVFFTGLSGETTIMVNPLTGESQVLRKTLMLHFAMPGTGVHPQGQKLVSSDEKWVMR